MEFVVLILDSVKVVCRGATAVPVFSSRILILMNGKFYAVKQYIRMVKEGAKEYLFGSPVTSVECTRQYVSARVNEERVEGENIATDLPFIFSGLRGNLNDDNMKELQEQGFDVDDDNLPNPQNVPESTPVAINSPPVCNFDTDCIV